MTDLPPDCPNDAEEPVPSLAPANPSPRWLEDQIRAPRPSTAGSAAPEPTTAQSVAPAHAPTTPPSAPIAPVERQPRTSLQSLSPVAMLLGVSVALLGNVALRFQATSLAASGALLVAASLTYLRPGLEPKPASRPSAVAAAAAVVFALLAPLRASGWLAGLNTGVAFGALVCLVVLRHRSATRFTSGSLRAGLGRVLAGFEAPGIVVRTVARAGDRESSVLVPVLRGVALAVFPVVVLAALLVSADAVFADILNVDFDFGSLLGHGALTLACLLLVVGLLAIADAPTADETKRTGRLGAVEAVVVLASIACLFCVFAVIQLVSALGMADDALARQGMSPADYARSGYFQLLWVATLTALLLLAMRVAASSHPSQLWRVVDMLGALVSTLTVVVVASAIVRLGLYTKAFGHTTLRWYSNAFALLLGAGFVLAAAAHLWARPARLLARTLAGLTLAAVVACNAINPEALVAQHNIDQARNNPTAELDTAYLSQLSADAWPVLVANRDVLTGAAPRDDRQAQTLEHRCTKASRPLGWGLLGLNIARLRVDCSPLVEP